MSPTILAAPGRASSALPNAVTWTPLSQQAAESDTLLLGDFTSYATINAQGGVLNDPNVLSNKTQAQIAPQFTFGAGKFTTAILPTLTGGFVSYPIDGLAGSDEMTVECWAMHPTLDWGNAACTGKIFQILTPTIEIIFELVAGQLYARSSTFRHAPTSANVVTTILALAGLGLTPGVFHEVAFTLKGNVITYYFDGVARATRAGFNSPLVSDTAALDGLMFAGDQGAAPAFWVGDARVSRTARVPSVVTPRRTMVGDVAIDTTSNAGAVPANFLGSLHPAAGNPPPAQLAAAVKAIRTANPLGATPMKVGAVDGTHPTLGQSGLFSYDWQVVDRTFDYLVAKGVAAVIDVDSTPQLLGGANPPFSGANLATQLFGGAAYNPQVPLTTAGLVAGPGYVDWVNIVKDFIHHVRVVKGYAVQRWSVWNEPNLAPFWAGTRAQWMDLYVATANAIRAIDATTPIGGPEVAQPQVDKIWINDLFAKVALNPTTPLDFIAVHDYSGDRAALDDLDRIIGEYAVANGRPRAQSWSLSETSWNDTNLYQANNRTYWTNDFWHVRAFGASYLSARLAHALTLPILQFIFTDTCFGSPRQGPIDIYRATALLGPNNEQWATYNTAAGWQMILGTQKLVFTADLPPGIDVYAGKDTVSGRVGVAVVSYGWGNSTPRTVNLHLTGMAGTKRVRTYLVDPTHSSRWDVYQDAPAGSVADGLVLVSDRTVSAARARDIQVVAPKWSTTFLTLD